MMNIANNLNVIQRFITPILGAGLLALFSCQALLGEPTPSESTPVLSPDPATIQATPLQLPNTAADTIDTLPQSEVITLSLWFPDQFLEQTATIEQQLNQFIANNPEVMVEVAFKRTSGQASALNYLRSAKTVAPKVLPDVVIFSTDELPLAWRSQIIQPLTRRVDRTIVEDLLPIARMLGQVEGELVGLPFEFNVEHLVYNTNKVFTHPITWGTVLSHSIDYQFPADGQNGLLNDALLIQYLSAEATLIDDEGKPTIDAPALRELLTYYQTLNQANIVPPEVVNATYAGGLWDDYLAGLIDATTIDAHRYLQDRTLLSNVAVGPIPSPDERAITIGHGWTFALVTEDANRQKVALSLIESVMQPQANANWASETAVLPTRQAAFDQVMDDDPYWQFLSTYIELTIPPPSFAGYDQLSRILLIAMQQVLSGEATPDEAVETAIEALAQSAS
jgi:multiple sugar transport system substrate-binding protein